MKALTIKQPYAYFVACGVKDIENRSWKTNYRGRILIHAGSKEVENGYENLTDSQKHKVRFHKGEKSYLSAIIGSVEIVDCVQNHPSVWAEKGKWNWVLANPIVFKKPIANVRGQLSLWEYKGEMPNLQEMSESCYYSECKRTAREMLEKLTTSEQMQISFAPLIYTHIAWQYAFQAIEEAKIHRVEKVKKLCRTLKELHQDYIRSLYRDLDHDHIKHIDTESNNTLDGIRMDMLKFYFAINNEFKRVYPNEPFDKMRSYAIISELVIALLIEHNKDMDKFLVDKKIKNDLDPTMIDEHTEKLLGLITEMASIGNDFNFENMSIQIGLSVIKRKIQEIDFECCPN